MKKFITALFLVFSVFIFSCSSPDSAGDGSGGDSGSSAAQVRFQNNFTDGTYLSYGIGLGEAKYSGSLYPGNVTSYKSTTEGSYSVQLKGEDGLWHTDSLGSFYVEGGHSYTVVISGTLDTYWYNLIQDS
ncbi:MAG: hypothetical protein RBT69_13745 [Spirochaetia bacterium]|jgi:hypothetical protein|nr:hypothetical protein [Spirochaetia bacterium]